MTEDLLNAEGLESYIEHWREHMERQKMTELYAELPEETQVMEGECPKGYATQGRPGPYRR